MKQVLEKIIKCLPYIFMALFFTGFLFLIPVEAYDEIWNFQNILKMYNGHEIYTECNAIVTPIFYYIGLGFLKVFGDNLISLRIFNVIIQTCYFVFFSLILKKLNVSKHLRCVMISMLFLQISRSMNGGANYNGIGITLIMLGMLFYLYFEDKKYFHFLQGLMIFLIFMTKQNLGVFYAVSILVYEIWNKSDILQYIINQLKKFVVFALGVIVTTLLFYYNGNLYEFVNYTFGGLLDFGTKNIIFNVPLYLVGYIIGNLAIVIAIFKIKPEACSEEFMKNLKLLLSIAIGSTLSCYPLCNEGHVLHIIGFYFLIFFYFLDYSMLEDVFKDKKYEVKSYLLSSFLILVLVIRFVGINIELQKTHIIIKDSESPFNNLYISKEDYNKINVMKDYIEKNGKEGKDVLILASDSCLTSMTLNKYNGELDLPFVGNLGYKGEEIVIEKLKKLDDTQILIFTNEEDCFWQESELIRNYIIDNLEKKGEILNYTIYE